MLPKKLSDILDNYDPEDLDIIISKVDYDNTNSKFDFQLSIISWTEEKFDHAWFVKTKQYRKSKILFDRASTLQIAKEHPVLWEFSDIQSEIYFNGQCNNIDQLYLGLCKVHKALFKDLTAFDETINGIDFYQLMSASNGLLAKGPKKLLVQYGEVLEQNGIKYSIIGDSMPTYWNGQHLPEVGNAKALFIDNSYIIADEFQFQ